MREEVLVLPNSLISYIIGGIPENQLTLIAGPAGCGKSTFVSNLIKWIKLNSSFKTIVLDAERSLRVRLELFGIFDKVDYYEVPLSLEDALKIQLDLVLAKNGDKEAKKELEEKGVPYDDKVIVFWDTITSSPFRAELKALKTSLKDLTERDFPIGLVAQTFSVFLKNLIPALNDITLVYVSQIRAKISPGGPYVSTTDIPGGYALKHYSSSIIEFKSAGLEEDGQWVKIKLSKSKYFPPKSGEVYMSFAEGFDERISLVKALIKKVWKTAWIKVGEKSYLGKNLLTEVQKNDELWNLILEKMKKEEILLEKLIE